LRQAGGFVTPLRDHAFHVTERPVFAGFRKVIRDLLCESRCPRKLALLGSR
jgi:hypothetical protein